MLGKKPMVSVLPLNNLTGIGEKSPSLSLGVYYNSIMVDKNIARTSVLKKSLIFGVFLDDTCCNNSMHPKKGKTI